ESVRAARGMLTAELQRRGAIVYWFTWPEDTPEGINGVDDLIGTWGPERVLPLVEQARPAWPDSEHQRQSEREFSALGEDRYRLSLPAVGVAFEIDRLRREHHELIGELSVRCDLPGARTIAGTLSVADYNLSSSRARSERAKLLAERSKADKLDWQG